MKRISITLQVWAFGTCCASQVVLVVKNLLASAGDIRDAGLIPGSGRSLGGGHGNPLQYFCLENPTDRGNWWATVHGVTKSRTRLKRLSVHPRPVINPLLPSCGDTWTLQRWLLKECSWKSLSNSAELPPHREWGQRRRWHPTPVLLPGKSHGRRSLVGCRSWGRKESDTTEAT